MVTNSAQKVDEVRNRIAALILHSGKSYSEVSKLSLIARTTLNRKLAPGGPDFFLKELIGLAGALEVSLTYLLTGLDSEQQILERAA